MCVCLKPKLTIGKKKLFDETTLIYLQNSFVTYQHCNQLTLSYSLLPKQVSADLNHNSLSCRQTDHFCKDSKTNLENSTDH